MSIMPSNERLRIFVYGTVQGVFFRRSAKQEADKLGVFGFARNLEDGSVEMLVEGKKEQLQKLLEWCWKGPKDAKVTSVEFMWSEAYNIFESFKIA